MALSFSLISLSTPRPVRIQDTPVELSRIGGRARRGRGGLGVIMSPKLQLACQLQTPGCIYNGASRKQPCQRKSNSVITYRQALSRTQKRRFGCRINTTVVVVGSGHVPMLDK